MGAVYSYLFGESPFDASWPAYEEKMRAEGLSNAAIAAFKYNFKMLTSGACLLPTHCCCCTTSPSLLLSPHLSPGSPLALLSLSLSLSPSLCQTLPPAAVPPVSLAATPLIPSHARSPRRQPDDSGREHPAGRVAARLRLAHHGGADASDRRHPAAPHTLSPWWL